jgi:hypothetical protein
MKRWVSENTYHLPAWEVQQFAAALHRPIQRQEFRQYDSRTRVSGKKPSISSPAQKRKRGRPMKEDWRALVLDYESRTCEATHGALTLRHFCQERGIRERTFRHARRRLNLGNGEP